MTMSTRPKNQIPDEKTGPNPDRKSNRKPKTVTGSQILWLRFRFVVGENRFFGAAEDFFSDDRDDT